MFLLKIIQMKMQSEKLIILFQSQSLAFLQLSTHINETSAQINSLPVFVLHAHPNKQYCQYFRTDPLLLFPDSAGLHEGPSPSPSTFPAPFPVELHSNRKIIHPSHPSPDLRSDYSKPAYAPA